MLRSALLPAILLGVLAAPALAQGPTVIEPGYWDVTNRAEVAVIKKTTHEKRCITPAQAAKFVMGPGNSKYACTYPTRVFQDGRITLKGACVDKKGQQAQVSATGAYSPNSFQMTAEVEAKYLGAPVSARFTTDARRLGDVCPQGAKTG